MINTASIVTQFILFKDPDPERDITALVGWISGLKDKLKEMPPEEITDFFIKKSNFRHKRFLEVYIKNKDEKDKLLEWLREREEEDKFERIKIKFQELTNLINELQLLDKLDIGTFLKHVSFLSNRLKLLDATIILFTEQFLPEPFYPLKKESKLMKIAFSSKIDEKQAVFIDRKGSKFLIKGDYIEISNPNLATRPRISNINIIEVESEKEFKRKFKNKLKLGYEPDLIISDINKNLLGVKANAELKDMRFYVRLSEI